jgi:hypothetical protein
MDTSPSLTVELIFVQANTTYVLANSAQEAAFHLVTGFILEFVVSNRTNRIDRCMPRSTLS